MVQSQAALVHCSHAAKTEISIFQCKVSVCLYFLVVVYVKTSAWGRVECELRGLLDDKLHFIKTVCVKANTTIRILGSNPLSASALLLFLHVHTGGRKCIVCQKRKWIWNTLHRDSFTVALVYVACDKKTNVKCVNFDSVKQLEGLLETQQPPAKVLLSLSYFFCSFRGESLKVNSTGTAWQPLLQLHQQWLAALFLAKLCKRCFQLCPVLLILWGRILQAWHQPVKLAYCLKLKLLLFLTREPECVVTLLLHCCHISRHRQTRRETGEIKP